MTDLRRAADEAKYLQQPVPESHQHHAVDEAEGIADDCRLTIFVAFADSEIGLSRPPGDWAPSRPFIGALLLGYYGPDIRLIYAGRVGSRMRVDQLEAFFRRLQPLRTEAMPLDVAPPRSTRFGSPLVLARVHWVRPELVAEVKYLTRTDDGLLRQIVYEGLREDNPAREVRREMPHPIARTVNKSAPRRKPHRR